MVIQLFQDNAQHIHSFVRIFEIAGQDQCSEMSGNGHIINLCPSCFNVYVLM